MDLETSDVDSSPDKGTHSNFNNEKSSDSAFDTLTEEDTPNTEWLDADGFDSTYTDWLSAGVSPYLGAQDQPVNYVYENAKDGDIVGWFDFAGTTFSGSSLSVNIPIYCNNDDSAGNDYAEVLVDYTGGGSLVGTIGQHTGWSYDTIDLGTHTVFEINNLRIYLVYKKSGAADDVRVDHARIGVAEPTNYETDLEVQFTSVATIYDVTDLAIARASLLLHEIIYF